MNNIYKIKEISDSNDGCAIVNSYLEKGWTFISACQIGNVNAMNIVYIIGATKEIYESTKQEKSILSNLLD